ncbi:MAG: SMC family ATPase [Ignavibacteriaceae bacterium]|nr:SMC family ATPase [Ignavibacteriaceae bacterium]
MQIISIKLLNFKQYKDAAVTFGEGLTGFIGKNGAGKSTVFEAIAYALFGRVDGSLSEIRNDKAAENAPVEVTLCFEDRGQDYKVIRKISGRNNTSQAELFKGELPVCNGTTAVNKEISRILKSDYKNFNLSFFARQKEVGQIQTLNKSERSGHIRQMLGLSKLDRLEELLKIEAKQLESERKGMKTSLMSDEKVKNLNDDIKVLNEVISETEQKIAHAEDEVKSAESAKSDAISAFRAAQEMQNRYNQLNSKIEVKQTGIENTEKNIVKLTAEITGLEEKEEEYRNKSGVREEYRQAEEELASLRILRDGYNKREQLLKNLAGHDESWKKTEQELSSDTARLNALAGNSIRLEAKQNETAVLTSAIDENKAAAGIIENTLAPLKSARSKDEKRLQHIKKLGIDADCPECERPLGDHYDLLIRKYTGSIKETDEKINILTVQLTDVNTRGTELRETLQKCTKELNDFLKIKNDEDILKALIAGHEKQRAEKEELISGIKEELNGLGEINFDAAAFEASEKKVTTLKKENDELNKLEGEISKLPGKRAELPELNERLNTLNSELADLRKDLLALGYDPVVFDQIQENRDKAENNLLAKEKFLGELKNGFDVKNSELNGINQRLSDNEKNKKAVEDAENTKLLYDRLRETVTGFKNTVTSRELPEISRIASHLFSQITAGRYEDLRISEDFELYVSRDSKSVLLSTLSGGEKDLAALCIRIALSKRISTLAGRNNMGFLALDEVFGSQDRERRDELTRTLNTISAEFRQIFVVSHNEDVQEEFPNRLVISRKAGFSDAVLVRA